jgi:hypothetical protein
MGLQMPIAIFLAALFKWNKIAAAAGAWITNPVTAPFLYSLTYFIGSKIYGINKVYSAPDEMTLSLAKKLLAKSSGGLLVLIHRRSCTRNPPGYCGILCYLSPGLRTPGRDKEKNSPAERKDCRKKRSNKREIQVPPFEKGKKKPLKETFLKEIQTARISQIQARVSRNSLYFRGTWSMIIPMRVTVPPPVSST